MATKNDQQMAQFKFNKRQGQTYTVKQGDSWFRIAGKIYGQYYGGSLEGQRMAGELARANGDINTLRPGMVIKIPKPRSTNPYIGANQFQGVTPVTGNVTTPQAPAPQTNALSTVPVINTPNYGPNPPTPKTQTLTNNLPTLSSTTPTLPQPIISSSQVSTAPGTYSLGGFPQTYNSAAEGGGGGGGTTTPPLVAATGSQGPAQPSTPTLPPPINAPTNVSTAPKNNTSGNSQYWPSETRFEQQGFAQQLAAGTMPYQISFDLANFNNLNPVDLQRLGYQLTSYGWVQKPIVGNAEQTGGGGGSYYSGGRGGGYRSYGGGGGYASTPKQPSYQYASYQVGNNPRSQTGRAFTPQTFGLINWRGI